MESNEELMLIADIFNRHSLKSDVFKPLMDSSSWVRAAKEYAVSLQWEIDALKRENAELKEKIKKLNLKSEKK